MSRRFPIKYVPATGYWHGLFSWAFGLGGHRDDCPGLRTWFWLALSVGRHLSTDHQCSVVLTVAGREFAVAWTWPPSCVFANHYAYRAGWPKPETLRWTHRMLRYDR